MLSSKWKWIESECEMIYYIIDYLHISDLILKLNIKKKCMWVIALAGDKIVPVQCKINGKDKEFEHKFLIICIHLNPVNNQFYSK